MNGALNAHRFILRVALSGAGTFAWIFAFQFYFDLYQSLPIAIINTAFLYIISQIVAALLTPLTAPQVRNGVRRSMVFAILSASTAFVTLGAALSDVSEIHLRYGLVAFAIFMGIYRAFYWVPYAVEKGYTSTASDFITTAEQFIVAGIPLVFGLTLEQGMDSDVWLSFLSGGLILISFVPLMMIPEKFERYSWGYQETFGHLLEPRYQQLVWSSILDGAQSAILYFLWPLVAFLLLGYSYASLGAVVAMALMLAIPARMFGKAYARLWKFESPIVPMVISGSVWLMRMAVATPLGIIFVDTLSVTSPTKTVAAAPIHEHTADAGSYIDELTALKELGLALGRIFMVAAVCSLALVLPLVQALAVTFIAVAVFAMTSVWIQHQREEA